jgi:4-hydroxybenzoyl-CoA thioesterase/acyl-CoA thioester hydrolase
MAESFLTQRRVEFCQTDAAGIAHFSFFFESMEQAEHELLRSLGLSVMASAGESSLSWPRVNARCDFRRAVRFEDVVEIAVEVARLGTKSVTYRFRFSHGDQPVAEGEMTSVCCQMCDGAPHPGPLPRGEGGITAVPVPEAFRVALRPFVSSV